MLFSCSNSAETKEETVATEETTTTTEEATPSSTGSAPLAMAKADPVCGMEKDSTWTDHVVADGDTTWFCSETCKSAYVGNPKKYMKK